MSKRTSIRNRVKQFYDWFNRENWERCFSFVDPKLRDNARVDPALYGASLAEFKRQYGGVQLWYIRVSLHADARANKHDQRPFAYVYVIWQDGSRAFHMFQERWVKQAGQWYTRVVGLVPQKEPIRARS